MNRNEAMLKLNELIAEIDNPPVYTRIKRFESLSKPEDPRTAVSNAKWKYEKSVVYELIEWYLEETFCYYPEILKTGLFLFIASMVINIFSNRFAAIIFLCSLITVGLVVLSPIMFLMTILVRKLVEMIKLPEYERQYSAAVKKYNGIVTSEKYKTYKKTKRRAEKKKKDSIEHLKSDLLIYGSDDMAIREKAVRLLNVFKSSGGCLSLESAKTIIDAQDEARRRMEAEKHEQERRERERRLLIEEEEARKRREKEEEERRAREEEDKRRREKEEEERRKEDEARKFSTAICRNCGHECGIFFGHQCGVGATPYYSQCSCWIPRGTRS